MPKVLCPHTQGGPDQVREHRPGPRSHHLHERSTTVLSTMTPGPLPGQPVTWAYHLHPSSGPSVLVVMEPSRDPAEPASVHAVSTTATSSDAAAVRRLHTLGWTPDGIWRVRSWGAAVPVFTSHPHT